MRNDTHDDLEEEQDGEEEVEEDDDEQYEEEGEEQEEYGEKEENGEDYGDYDDYDNDDYKYSNEYDAGNGAGEVTGDAGNDGDTGFGRQVYGRQLEKYVVQQPLLCKYWNGTSGSCMNGRQCQFEHSQHLQFSSRMSAVAAPTPVTASSRGNAAVSLLSSRPPVVNDGRRNRYKNHNHNENVNEQNQQRHSYSSENQNARNNNGNYNNNGNGNEPPKPPRYEHPRVLSSELMARSSTSSPTAVSMLISGSSGANLIDRRTQVAISHRPRTGIIRDSLASASSPSNVKINRSATAGAGSSGPPGQSGAGRAGSGSPSGAGPGSVSLAASVVGTVAAMAVDSGDSPSKSKSSRRKKKKRHRNYNRVLPSSSKNKEKKRVTNYKTKPCVDPGRGKRCLYALRCNFAHPGEALRRPMSDQYRDSLYKKYLDRDFPNTTYPFGIYV